MQSANAPRHSKMKRRWRHLLSDCGVCGLLALTVPCLLVTVVFLSSLYPVVVDHPCPSDLVSVQTERRPVAMADGTPEVTSTASPIDCLALMEGEERETVKAKIYMQSNQRRTPKATEVQMSAKDCGAFRRRGGYDRHPIGEDERDFPLAFSILVHTSVDQVERLLRALYRPHNSYCIHVDANADRAVLDSISAIADCFENVFIPSKLEPITYAHFSRLQADLNCMQELVRRSSTWRYVINLTGQMFPLKTNLEMVKILRTFGGLNDIEGLSKYVSESMKVRYRHRYAVVNKKLRNTREAKDPAPRNITLVKGSAYGAFTRPFVEYVFNSSVVQEFLNWTRDIYSPDEFFWASVNSRYINPMFLSPGGHDLLPERKPWIAAYAAWKKRDSCGGKFVRDVCIFGVSDLPSLLGRRELFANKFYADFDYLALDCIEEWLLNKTQHHLPIDLEYYRNAKQLLRIL